MSEGAMTKEEFVQGMKTLREEAAAKEAARKAKQREYNRRYSERKKAEKAEKVEEAAEAVADPEDTSMNLASVTLSEKGLRLDFSGVRLSGEEAAMLSLYIKDTICWALECDRYFNEDMIFTLVHLADRLGGER